MRLKAAGVLTEWNMEAVAARSAAGSAEGSRELSMEAVLCDLIIRPPSSAAQSSSASDTHKHTHL